MRVAKLFESQNIKEMMNNKFSDLNIIKKSNKNICDHCFNSDHNYNELLYNSTNCDITDFLKR